MVTSSRRKWLMGAAAVLLALVAVAVAAYATWPGAAAPRQTNRNTVATCDYASGDWMQQPGCDRPPAR